MGLAYFEILAVDIAREEGECQQQGWKESRERRLLDHLPYEC
jgi:hypothetical protein